MQKLRLISIYGIYIYSCGLNVVLAQDASPLSFTKILQQQQQETVPESNPIEYTLYEGEDDVLQTRSRMNHDIFSNEKFRIYNNTEYNFDEVKTKYQAGHLQHVSVADFSLSLGYGMEYQFRKNRWIGYEYLSAFPQDHGQAVRFFFRRRF